MHANDILRKRDFNIWFFILAQIVFQRGFLKLM